MCLKGKHETELLHSTPWMDTGTRDSGWSFFPYVKGDQSGRVCRMEHVGYDLWPLVVLPIHRKKIKVYRVTYLPDAVDPYAALCS